MVDELMPSGPPVAQQCYDVFTRTGMVFIGRMPMATLSRHYMLHREAEERVKRETLTSNDGCVLYFNRGDTKDIIVFAVPEEDAWAPQWGLLEAYIVRVPKISTIAEILRKDRIIAEAKDVNDGCRYRGYLISGADGVGWSWTDQHQRMHIKGHGVNFSREEVLADIDASMI